MMIELTPLPDDYTPGAGSLELEMLSYQRPPLERQLLELTDHDQQDHSLTTVLDWASQLRQKEALPWASAIQAAMTLYYG